MSQTPEPHTTDLEDSRPAVEVDVARTGGIAGITRRWSAQPPETEAPEWISLIDRCPWDEAGVPGEPARTADTADSAQPVAGADTPAASAARARPEEGRRPIPDGFVWWIRATLMGADEREAELFDDQVVGAWRDLIDAVREWSRHAPGPERPGR